MIRESVFKNKVGFLLSAKAKEEERAGFEPTMREPALNLERDLGIPLPITKDSQAAMAQPPPARVRDRSADLGTTYVM